MSVLARTLINAQYASAADTTLYTSAPLTTTIIDKFTATNRDAVAQTLTVHLVPSGGISDDSNVIVDAVSLAAHEAIDVDILKNHILSPGDLITVSASVGSKVVVRSSGRKVT